jgi:hypothetical protein
LLVDSAAPFEELHLTLVALGRFEGRKGAQIPPAMRRGVEFARVKTVSPGF